MKLSKIYLAAALALSSATAFSQTVNTQSFDGYAQAGFGSNKISGDNLNTGSERLMTLRGTFSFQDKTGFGVQFDNNLDRQNSELDSKIRSDDLAIHAFYRTSDYLLGFIHQNRKFKISQDGQSSVMPLERTFNGVEGQYYLKDVTLYGQFTRDVFNTGLIGNQKLKGNTNALEARYFINDNFRADLGYVKSDLSDAKATTLSVGVEYRLNNSPVSLFARHQTTDIDAAFLSGIDNKRYLVGVTYNFGKGSLKERDRSGASLNPIAVDNLVLGSYQGPQ